jgi:predicted transcriptional regulator YheO
MSHLERLGLLNLLERMAEGIVAVVGPHCEVVIHDFSNLEHSAKVIIGEVSGRKPGAPVPDLEFVSNELDENTPDQLNYRIKVGSKELQSSTIWIKDDHGTPVGAICINIDYAELNQASKILDRFIAPIKKTPDLVVQDTWARDLDELINLSVTTHLRQKDIPQIEDLTQDEKLNLIEVVEKQGLFKIRGAAKRLAEILNVTRASIYNYRASVKEKKSS